MTRLTPAQLRSFHPFSQLHDNRLETVLDHCRVVQVAALADPRAAIPGKGQAAYLLSGEIEINLSTGGGIVLRAGDARAQRALPHPEARGVVRSLRALTDCDLVCVDEELLDIVMTWDQMSTEELGSSNIAPAPTAPKSAPAPDEPKLPSEPASTASSKLAAVDSEPGDDWHLLSGVFSVESLTTGIFAALPAAHIRTLLERFESVRVRRDQVIVQEGDVGDYYYVISTGRAQVTRMIGGVAMVLAGLKSGAAFGEEALLTDARRNATVTMLTNGTLLRLSKLDFLELLKRPLLTEIGLEEARQRVASGAIWLDVRFPSEYQHDKLPGALNIPLGELRHAFSGLDRTKEYIAYCQSGRRSGAAAFLLAQRGFQAAVLAGGLRTARPGADD